MAHKPGQHYDVRLTAPDGYQAQRSYSIASGPEQKGVIACPCHAAFFTTNGNVISGPAPAPLPVYQVQVEGDQIYVEGGEG